MRNGVATILIIIILFLFGLLALLFLRKQVWVKSQINESSSLNNSSESSSNNSENTASSNKGYEVKENNNGWSTYQNYQGKYSIEFPQAWIFWDFTPNPENFPSVNFSSNSYEVSADNFPLYKKDHVIVSVRFISETASEEELLDLKSAYWKRGIVSGGGAPILFYDPEYTNVAGYKAVVQKSRLATSGEYGGMENRFIEYTVPLYSRNQDFNVLTFRITYKIEYEKVALETSGKIINSFKFVDQ